MPNIYILSELPEKAAQDLCDEHVKSCPEMYATLLATAHIVYKDGAPNPDALKSKSFWLPQYTAQFYDHPCARWVQADVTNYQWAYELLKYLVAEYKYRFGQPMGDRLPMSILSAVPNLPTQRTVPGKPVQHVPECNKTIRPGGGAWELGVKAYRQFYTSMAHQMLWTKRQPPDWFMQARNSWADISLDSPWEDSFLGKPRAMPRYSKGFKRIFA